MLLKMPRTKRKRTDLSLNDKVKLINQVIVNLFKTLLTSLASKNQQFQTFLGRKKPFKVNSMKQKMLIEND